MTKPKLDPVTPCGLVRSAVSKLMANCVIKKYEQKPGTYCGLCAIRTECWPNKFYSEVKK